MTTTAFWAAALALVALGWTLLCLPLLRRGGDAGSAGFPGEAPPVDAAGAGRRSAARQADAPAAEAAARERATANATFFAEQLQSLDADLAAGRIDAPSHQAAVLAIHRRLLEEADDGAAAAAAAPGRAVTTHARRGRALPLALAICLPAIAIGGYVLLGNPAALALPAAASAPAEPEVSSAEVAAMVDTLAARLENRPAAGAEDLQGWIMLGRSDAALQRFDAAARAYGRALALTPDDPQLLADRADMLAMQQGQRLDGEPERLIERALALDPKQLKALALAGSAAFERHRWDEASGYWRRARALVADGSDLATGLDRSLAEAAAGAGRETPGRRPEFAPGPILAVAAADAQGGTRTPAATGANAVGRATVDGSDGSSSTGKAAVHGNDGNAAVIRSDKAALDGSEAGASVNGSVRLSEALAAKVAPGDTVFVFARAAQGPRMPLAILRRTAADLPLAFRLDDSQAMSPALKLSNFPDVVVGVRISRSGQAMPQPGDLIGEAPATPGGAAVQVLIDRIQP